MNDVLRMSNPALQPKFAITRRVHADGKDQGHGTHQALSLAGPADSSLHGRSRRIAGPTWPPISGWSNHAGYHSQFASLTEALACRAYHCLDDAEIRVVVFGNSIGAYPLAGQK